MKQSCNSRQELSNDMWQALCQEVNPVNSWLLVVWSQTTSLTPSPSFARNLHSICPNEQCEPILNIYVSRAFQWSFNHWVLTPEIAFWRFRSPPGLQLPKLNSLGSVRVHFPSLSYTPGSMRSDSRAPSWPTTLQPLCLGHEPKARVTTYSMLCRLLRGWLH